MTGIRSVLVLTTLAACLAAPAAVSADDEQRVYVGVYLHDVTQFDQKNGVFDADVELWAKWLGEFDHDQLQIANGADIERTFLGHDVDGTWNSARWRVRGTLRGEFPVHRFPFDEQTLAVVLELPDRYGTLVPDVASSGMASSFSLTDWLYEPEFQPAAYSQVFTSDLGNLTNEGRSTTVNRVAYQVVMGRPIGLVLLKLFLPLGIIVLVALAALFIHPKNVAARSAMGVTALLSFFAFQFTVSDSLPSVAYLTLADTLFLVGYVIGAAAVVITIATYVLMHKEWARTALFVDRIFRILIPAGGLVAVWLAMPPPLPEREPDIDPMPVFARSESGRDTVRIGTTVLSKALGTPASTAAYWPVLYEDPWDGLQPVFIERAPGVDNDALRFLAGGHIEVTWRIREGMKWSDGTPLTADDMTLVLEAMPNPDIVEVTIPDDRTMVVHWSDRLAAALDPPWAWPAHVLRPIYDEGGYDAVLAHRRSTPLPSLGPYKIDEFVKKSHLEASANPHFPGPPPAIPNLEMVYYADREQLIADFEAGTIDIITPNSVTLEQARKLQRELPGAVHIRPSAIFIYMHPDLHHPLLGQEEVRQAIAMAVDRRHVARKVYGDNGRVAHVPVPGESPLGTTEWRTDKKRAKAMLKRAKASKHTITLFHGSSRTDKDIAKAVGADLKRAGMKIKFEGVKSTFKLIKAGDHGGLVISPVRGSRDSDPRRWWNLDKVDGVYPADARNDAYTDEVHALVEREKRALYPERREQLRDTLFAEYSERLPTIPLIFAAERMLADPTLENWDLDPQVMFGRGSERWAFTPVHSSVDSGPATELPSDGG